MAQHQQLSEALQIRHALPNLLQTKVNAKQVMLVRKALNPKHWRLAHIQIELKTQSLVICNTFKAS